MQHGGGGGGSGSGNDFAWSLAYGATSGALSSVVFQPLDVLKTRAQAAAAASQRRSTTNRPSLTRLAADLISQEGPMALWRGTLPTLLRTVPGLALYLATVRSLHSALAPSGRSVTGLGAVAEAAAVAAFARAGTAVALQPLVTLKTNIEAGGRCPPGLFSAAQWLWRSGGGLSAFYRGLAATLARDVPYSSVYFAVYSQAKSILIRLPVLCADHDAKYRLLRLCLASACGSLVATLATQPADVIKTHRQLLAIGGGSPLSRPGLLQLLQRIRASEGSLTAGLMRGLAPRLLRRFGFATVSWVTFEELHRLRMQRSVR